MAAASPISAFGAAACSCHGSSGSAMPKEAMPAGRNCPAHPAPADLGTGSPSSQNVLSAWGGTCAHDTSCLLSPLGSAGQRSWAQAFFELLIKDKPWHLTLWGGFDDLVAGFLLPGSGAGGEQEKH